jgi:hypothetical protein
MPKEQKIKKLTEKEQLTQDTLLSEELKYQFDSAEKGLSQVRDHSAFPWNEREALFLGVNKDNGSESSKSKVNTQDLQNLVIDGACRVMAQFPTGKIQALSEDDRGKNVLMNLILEKYIIENANAQWDMLTKFRVWDMYSRIYGAMPALVNWRVDNQYIGPDLYVIHPRHMRAQNGKTTIGDCDYVFVDSWLSLSWLKQRNTGVWRNISKLAATLKEKGDSKAGQPTENLTYQEQQDTAGMDGEKGNYAQVLLRTRYERNRWVTYAPSCDNLILRDIPNPQNNNQLPIVMKQCFPLMDRLYGLAEFERGKTLQYAMNSLVNLYLDGVKMSIFPPVVLNKSGVIPSSLRYQPGAKWVETEPNSIRRFESSPLGLTTFQSTFQFMKAALLNMGASSDTTITKEMDPGFGRTPQALQMQGAREGARDNWDRFMMEKAIESVYNKFINLVTSQQEKPIELNLFQSEIEKIKKAYPGENIVKIFQSGEFGQAKINKNLLAGDDEKNPVKYRFYIDTGTTMKKDDAKENETVAGLMALVIKNPQIIAALEAKGKTVDLGEMFQRVLITSGMQDWDKIIVDKVQPEAVEGIGTDGATIPTEQPMQEELIDPSLEQQAALMVE